MKLKIVYKITILFACALAIMFALDKILSQTSFLLITVLFLILLALFFLFLNLILDPLEKVKDLGNHIASGDLEYDQKLKTGDEIESIAVSFKNLAQQVKDSRISIEEQSEKSDTALSMLLRKDTDLRSKFSELVNEKAVISAERNKLKLVLSAITDAVIAVDLNRKIIIFNTAAEELTGYKADFAIGKDISELIKVYDQDQEVNVDDYCPEKIGDEGILFDKQDLKLIGSNNKQVFINLISGQIRGGANTNLGSVLTIHDKSSEKKLEEMKLDFVSMAAHELRTPLTSIRSYLSVLDKEVGDTINQEQKMFLNRALISSAELAGLVENLLSVSKIEKGKYALNIISADWVEIIKSKINDFSNQAAEKNITISFKEPEKPLAPVAADPLRVPEVLDNLISNALKYTAKDGKITIWLDANEKEVITHIQDTGQGIPKEALPYLFTKFFRVWGKLEMGSKGTGLGLYISKSIVEMHAGRIWVESEKDKGSTFSFSLPYFANANTANNASEPTKTGQN